MIPRWLPHDKNPADVMTKSDGAHVLPMTRLLASGSFMLQEETQELEARKATKEERGCAPRPRVGFRHGNALSEGAEDGDASSPRSEDWQ